MSTPGGAGGVGSRAAGPPPEMVLAQLQMMAGLQKEPPPGVAEDTGPLQIGEQGYTSHLPVDLAVVKGTHARGHTRLVRSVVLGVRVGVHSAA